ncbi:ArnT family glycosyltransferase [Ktedonobacter racemifer]|uniref:Glycosyltransferase RgtA/B/C/D-like domain-containing protein n=1 Tax=Ktedonobacter racemifer DSM 44963 TaxID=485913 RepID=D6TGE3_KTERA|nr:glycosyltransferase family 39 protein [Ktedonobacter racemifer]EFH90655.1 hypothetical protein Krac_12282 [Ktedonobacter racemifer DSM 44963]
MTQPFLIHKREVETDRQTAPVKFSDTIRRLLLSWEIYLILFITAFLRLFNIDKVIFNDDEAGVFRMAHDAIANGWLPLTSNRASLGNLNPPFVIYLFMLPASLSADPLWGQVMVALFNTAAVLLTYFFVRRYYGRLAGTIAALLYATSVWAWTYSRNIWPQNFLPFFIMLFMFTLFRGVVERRKGWFFWAIVLIGILYQFHGSTLYLLAPLTAAVLFAFKTIRWRDIGLAAIVLLLLFAPYIVWEYHTNFADVTMILHATTGQQATIDTEALRFYLSFIRPMLANPYLDPIARIRDNHLLLPNAQSILATTPLRHLYLFLRAEFYVAILLLLGGLLIAAMQILSFRRSAPEAEPKKGILARWWSEFWASPYKQGLVLLLLWQVAPLLFLTRHSIVLFAHYFIFFVPGQFIFMALCTTQIIAFVQKYRPGWGRLARYGMGALAALVILAQLIGSSSTLFDLTMGNFNDHSVFPPYNDLHSEQNALQEADRVAQQRHINRIYVTTIKFHTAQALEDLSGQVKTPVALINIDDCFMLPSPEAGPVVFLVTPNDWVTNTILNQYTNATLVSTPPHLGGDPYDIYVLTTKPAPAPVPHAFTQGLQLISPTAQLLQNSTAGRQLLTTRWSIPSTNKPAPRTHYGFNFRTHANEVYTTDDNINCLPTATWAGDQLFVFHKSQQGNPFPSQISLQVSTYLSQPQALSAGPLTMFTYYEVENSLQTLLTADGKNSITLPTTNASN